MRIDFRNPRQRIGLNSTVRKGVRKEFQGEFLDIYETGGDIPIATNCEVLTVITLPYQYITDDMLKYQHTKETQSYGGLLEVMRQPEVYGPEFTEEDIVTIVMYVVENVHPMWLLEE